jgi:hypothetical protein
MTVKTTKAHLRIFEKECRRLQKLWGLNGWTLFVVHEQRSAEVAAAMGSIPDNRKLWAYLNTAWPDEQRVTVANLKAAARHEMVHCLMDPLRWLAAERWVTQREYDAASHEVLEHLQRLLP